MGVPDVIVVLIYCILLESHSGPDIHHLHYDHGNTSIHHQNNQERHHQKVSQYSR